MSIKSREYRSMAAFEYRDARMSIAGFVREIKTMRANAFKRLSENDERRETDACAKAVAIRPRKIDGKSMAPRAAWSSTAT